MIKSIKLKEDYVCFFKNESFDFKPITLLVGDQGCGKSTMLGLIKEVIQSEECPSYAERETEDVGIEDFMMFDFEKNNPRVNPSNPNSSEDMLYGMGVRFSSHGEALLPIAKEIENFENTLILLDEPESSLSLRSQYTMIEIFKKCVERNNQLIIATHNLEFIKAFPDSILNLEKKKYVTPDQFVKSQKESSNFKTNREDKIIKKNNCRMGVDCECTKDSPWYDKTCVHYVDRMGKSGYNRRGEGPNSKMKKGDFKNG